MRNYKSVDGRITLPPFNRDRAAFDVHGSWLDAPSVAFFGVGFGLAFRFLRRVRDTRGRGQIARNLLGLSGRLGGIAHRGGG